MDTTIPHQVEKELGELVCAIRLERRLDQQSLADQAAVSLSSLQDLESGKGSSLRTLLRVLHALYVSVAQIVDDFERKRVLDALEQSKWKKADAAKLLGIKVKVLDYWIEKYRLARA